MLGSLIKSTLTNFRRTISVSIINYGCLILALSVFLLTSTHLISELSYDSHWADASNLYRINTVQRNGTQDLRLTGGPFPLYETLKNGISDDIEIVTRGLRRGDKVTVADVDFTVPLYVFDKDVLEIFDFEEIEGSLEETFLDPKKIAVREDIAKILGEGSLLGKTITLNLNEGVKVDYTVSAVYRIPGKSSVITFPMLGLFDDAALPEREVDFQNWGSGGVSYYLKVRGDNEDKIHVIDEGLRQFINFSVPANDLGRVIPPGQNVSEYYRFELQPLKDVHFNPTIGETGGSRLQNVILAAIAGLVFIIGIGNFATLNSAKTLSRSKEVCVRKCLGATARQILSQALLENIFLMAVAVCLSLFLWQIALPTYKAIAGAEVVLPITTGFKLVLVALFILVLGLFGGLYPSWLLSKISPTAKPSQVVGVVNTRYQAVARKGLVVLQLFLSVGLLYLSSLLAAQLRFIESFDKGFRVENVLITYMFGAGARVNSEALINEIRTIPGVTNVTAASTQPFRPGGLVNNLRLFRHISDNGDQLEQNLNWQFVSFDFFETFDIQRLAGRFFDEELDSGQISQPNQSALPRVILNNSAARAFGFSSPAEALGKQLTSEFAGQAGEVATTTFEVIGVSRDAPFNILDTGSQPQIYTLGRQNLFYGFIHYDKAAESAIVEAVRQKWESVLPGEVFQHSYVAENLRLALTSHTATKRILSFATSVAMLISILSLMGMATHIFATYIKDIAVRKALGASNGSIFVMLGQQLMIPLLMAGALAFPVSIVISNWLLQSFPQRVAGWQQLALYGAAFLAMWTFAFLSIMLQTINASRASPVKGLRYD